MSLESLVFLFWIPVQIPEDREILTIAIRNWRLIPVEVCSELRALSAWEVRALFLAWKYSMYLGHISGT